MSPSPSNPLEAAAASLESARNPALAREAILDVAPAATLGGCAVLPVSLETVLLLEEIDSPFTDDAGATDVTARDAAAAAFIMTRDGDEVEGLLRQGRDKFDTAVRRFSRGVKPAEFARFSVSLVAHMKDAFSTALGSSPAGEAGEEKKTTTNSSVPAATGSAGG